MIGAHIYSLGSSGNTLPVTDMSCCGVHRRSAIQRHLASCPLPVTKTPSSAGSLIIQADHMQSASGGGALRG